MKQEIRLPKGYELKELEKGVYEIVKSEFKLEVGKDYIAKNGNWLVINRAGDYGNYGFDDDCEVYFTSLHCSTPNGWREATKEEVKKRFERHLIKRYGEDWKSVRLKTCMYFEESDLINTSAYDCYIKKNIDDIDGWSVWNKNGCLYSKGKWAEVLEEKKVATDLSDIDRPYCINEFGVIETSNKIYRESQTKNCMTSIELCEGILALQQLIAFRDNFHEVHGAIYGNNHGSIRFDGNEFMACNIIQESVEAAIFDFDTYNQAKEFYETHKNLFEELKKLYWKDSLHKIKHV